MRTGDLAPLAAMTLRQPRAAARTVLDWALPRDVLWSVLALVAIVNTVILQALIATSPPEAQAQFPSYFQQPLAVFVLLAGILVIYVHAVFWSGRALGGQGTLDELLALVVWLQVMRTAAQLALLVLTFAVPALAGLLSLVVFVWGIWILLSFIAEGLQLKGTGHALLVMVLALLGLVLGVGVLLALIGAVAQGVPSNV